MNWIFRAPSFATSVAAVAALAMMIQVTADVVAKYLFDAPIDGTEEIVSYYYMIAVVVLPLATVELKGEHISVDILYDRLPPVGRATCDAIARLLSVGVFAALSYQSFVQALQSYQVGEMSMGAASVIIWPTRFFLPVGFLLIALACLVRLLSIKAHGAEDAAAVHRRNEPV